MNSRMLLLTYKVRFGKPHNHVKCTHRSQLQRRKIHPLTWFTRWSRVHVEHRNPHWAFAIRFLFSRIQTRWQFIICSSLTYTTSETDRSVTSCEKGFPTGFQNWDDYCFSPGRWDSVLCQYTVVHEQQKLLTCRWKVRVVSTIGVRWHVAAAFECCEMIIHTDN
jgi:hypothetical protein